MPELFAEYEAEIEIERAEDELWLAEHGPTVEAARPSWAVPVDRRDQDFAKHTVVTFQTEDFGNAATWVQVRRMAIYDEKTRELTFMEEPLAVIGETDVHSAVELRELAAGLLQAADVLEVALNAQDR